MIMRCTSLVVLQNCVSHEKSNVDYDNEIEIEIFLLENVSYLGNLHIIHIYAIF